MPRHINPRCKRCGYLLSKDYAYDYCPSCWQKKYHAPPGYNYFPPDKDAAKLPAAIPPDSFLVHLAVGSSDSVLARHTGVLVA